MFEDKLPNPADKSITASILSCLYGNALIKLRKALFYLKPHTSSYASRRNEPDVWFV